MTEVIKFDSLDELPPFEKFEAMRDRYWVLRYKSEERPYNVLLSPQRPLDVPNGSMAWFRPTYGDYMLWLEGKVPSAQGNYRRSTPAPPLCQCGHGSDSHYGSHLNPGTGRCRMSCMCFSFKEQA